MANPDGLKRIAKSASRGGKNSDLLSRMKKVPKEIRPKTTFMPDPDVTGRVWRVEEVEPGKKLKPDD